MDVLDFWNEIRSELPGMNGLCTQVTAFLDKAAAATAATDVHALPRSSSFA